MRISLRNVPLLSQCPKSPGFWRNFSICARVIGGLASFKSFAKTRDFWDTGTFLGHIHLVIPNLISGGIVGEERKRTVANGADGFLLWLALLAA